MDPMGRFFLCARCRKQVLLCSGCDRGQLYCAEQCSAAARHASVREAGRRYQSSHRGRLAHAERSRRYRARRNKVTHQGSPAPLPDDLLSADSAVSAAQAHLPARAPVRSAWHCHVCGNGLSEFVRCGFLRSRRVAQTALHYERRGADRGHSP